MIARRKFIVALAAGARLVPLAVFLAPGGNLDDFTFNANALGDGLSRLDFVVLTHRHGDHPSGLHQVLKVNPAVRIYTPAEAANFDTPTPPRVIE